MLHPRQKFYFYFAFLHIIIWYPNELSKSVDTCPREKYSPNFSFSWKKKMQFFQEKKKRENWRKLSSRVKHRWITFSNTPHIFFIFQKILLSLDHGIYKYESSRLKVCFFFLFFFFFSSSFSFLYYFNITCHVPREGLGWLK